MLFLAFLLLFTNILILSGGAYAYVKARNVVGEVKATVFSLATPETEGQLSPIGQMFHSVSTDMAEQIGVTVQAAIRGSFGGTMKGVNAELEQVAIQENPSLAMTQYLPKSLKKNPLAMAGVQALVQRFLAGAGSGAAAPRSNGNNHRQSSFEL